MSADLSQSARTSPPVSAADIDAAAQRISDVVTRTPLQLSERLSEATGATVYLKREDLQAVRSYKLRGANNLLMQLSADEIAAGVVCSSAGNHAQGFAMACRSMGIHGRVYVPAKTPKQKRDRIRYHGARVHRADRRRQDLRRGRRRRARRRRAHRRHPGAAV